MSDKRSSTRSRVKARKVAPFEALLSEKARLDGELLSRLKKDLPKLEALLANASDGLRYEDYIYRFYHQSFKVYYLQGTTMEIVEALKLHAIKDGLNPWFLQIVAEGTEKEFRNEHNRQWLAVTRPIVEAYFHARYFLEMVCRYAKELDEAPQVLPSGWAAVLYLYNIR